MSVRKPPSVSSIARILSDKMCETETLMPVKTQREFLELLTAARTERRPKRMTPDQVCEEIGIDRMTYLSTMRSDTRFQMAVSMELNTRFDELHHRLQSKALDLVDSPNAESEDIQLALKIYKDTSAVTERRRPEPVARPAMEIEPSYAIEHSAPKTSGHPVDYDESHYDPFAGVTDMANKAMNQTTEELGDEQARVAEKQRDERNAREKATDLPDDKEEA